MENIVIGIKENFKIHAYIMLYSLMKNNVDRLFNISILSDSLDIEYFRPLEEKFKCKIELYLIDISDIKNLNYRHIDTSTFYRLKMDKYVRHDIDRVLYLDTDIIINSSISELLDMKFDDNELVAAVECKISTKHLSKIGFSNSKYFNAGMIYFNYKKCIEQDIFKKSLKLILDNDEKFNFMDQDVLNIVLKNKVKYISPKWNYGSYFAISELLGSKVLEEEPAIIHYTGTAKPWNYMNINKYSYLYFNFYKEIFSKKLEIYDKSILKIIKRKVILSIYGNKFSSKIIMFFRNKYRK